MYVVVGSWGLGGLNRFFFFPIEFVNGRPFFLNKKNNLNRLTAQENEWSTKGERIGPIVWTIGKGIPTLLDKCVC